MAGVARHVRRLSAVFVVSGALSVTPRPALASVPAVAFALSYDVPEECPTRAQFVRRVGARSALVHIEDTPARAGGDLRGGLEEDGTADRLEVKIEARGSLFVGTLTIVRVERRTRQLSASRCTDLVDAFSIFVALAVDPDANVATLDLEEVEPPVITPPEPPPEQSEPPVIPPPRTRPRTKPPRGPGAEEPAERARWSASLGVTAQTGIGPTLAGALVAGAELTLPIRGAPSVRLGAAYARALPLEYGAGQATFAALFSRVEACPFRIRAGARMEIAPCGVFDAGLHSASLERIPAGLSSERLWLAGGVEGRLILRALQGAGVEATVGGIAPLEHVNFSTRSGPIHRTPEVAVFSGLHAFLVFR